MAVRKPRGRPPKGKIWDGEVGQWVAKPEEVLVASPLKTQSELNFGPAETKKTSTTTAGRTINLLTGMVSAMQRGKTEVPKFITIYDYLKKVQQSNTQSHPLNLDKLFDEYLENGGLVDYDSFISGAQGYFN